MRHSDVDVMCNFESKWNKISELILSKITDQEISKYYQKILQASVQDMENRKISFLEKLRIQIENLKEVLSMNTAELQTKLGDAATKLYKKEGSPRQLMESILVRNNVLR